jgi:tetrahydromethanopterin S-methyltransferase subunit F
MTYEDDNQPNWGEFTNYVENLKENKELFAEGRVLQPGDELYIPTSYGKVEESPDK